MSPKIANGLPFFFISSMILEKLSSVMITHLMSRRLSTSAFGNSNGGFSIGVADTSIFFTDPHPLRSNASSTIRPKPRTF